MPIAVIVFIICFFIVPVPNSALLAFVVSVLFVVLGMALFTLGTDVAMTPIGEYVGQAITHSRKLWIIVLIGFAVGVMITISEPDLQVLAEQVPGVPNMILIMAVAIGVGLFLVVALLRILFAIRISILLAAFYVAVFVLAQYVPENFLAVAFDSGGVTTGPMTVPFILALGVGVASIRNDSNSENDSFGLVALCSIGPILAVMILSLIYRPETTTASTTMVASTQDSLELWEMFISHMPEYLRDVAIALLPIAGLFALLQFISIKLPFRAAMRIAIGLIYTYLGLVFFLLGVNVGFMPVGNYIGSLLGELDCNWILVPVGMIIGYFVVSAEPAVHVLSKQVYDITSGAIPAKALKLSLSIGVCVSVGLAMIRVLTGISIMSLLIPGYVLALALMIFSPPIFTSIAFDSGGVASGPMTATFLLPLAMGACSAVGGDIAADAFGVVAMVAMTPLITIQILGIVYRLRTGTKQLAVPEPDDEIIEV
ncbi:MAG: DUF1538 domain-containing protein [Clostridia bacterium]|nr:DUF1538 domain-containing protein [Clostridia bacterium]